MKLKGLVLAEPRFFCDDISQPITVLQGSEARHLGSVMRLKQGDRVELFDGEGSLARATVVSAGKNKAELSVEKIERYPRPESGRIILVVSLAKGQRFDWLIGKVTELGVDGIVPTIYKRTVKLGGGKSLLERYRNLAISASKQCRGLFLPEIHEAEDFYGVVERLREELPGAKFITSSLADDAVSLFDHNRTGSFFESGCDKVVFIGPEGGLTSEEEEHLKSQGAVGVRLTKTVLRVETAALAISSVLTIARDSV